MKDARSARFYIDKRETYRSILDDLLKGKYWIEDAIKALTNDRKRTALEILTEFDRALTETIDDAVRRNADIGIFGPDQVAKAHRVFIAAWNDATDPLTPPERFVDTPDDELRTELINALREGLSTMEKPMKDVREACRDDLAE